MSGRNMITYWVSSMLLKEISNILIVFVHLGLSVCAGFVNIDTCFPAPGHTVTVLLTWHILLFQITTRSMSSSTQVELENRLHSLTESLIQKQTMMESLSTEKNSLTLQLERLEVSTSYIHLNVNKMYIYNCSINTYCNKLSHFVYVTGNLCNQALRVMTEHFSHFVKCLNSLAISRNVCVTHKEYFPSNFINFTEGCEDL